MASEEPSSVAGLSPTRFLTLDFSDPESCAAAAREFVKEHPIRGVVGVDDRTTRAAAAIAESLSLPQNPPLAVEIAQDKLLTRRCLGEAGISQPRFREMKLPLSSAEGEEIEFPCVLKPLHLSGGAGVIRADDVESFVDGGRHIEGILQVHEDEKIRGDGRILVEEYVPGWEIAVEGIVREGRLSVLAVFDKPDPLEGPYFAESIYVTPSNLSGEILKKVTALTEEACVALGLISGPIHAELRGDGENLWIIEIAPRSIGGLCSRTLRFGAGVTLESLIIRHHLGLSLPEEGREDRSAGVRMIHAPKAGVFRGFQGLDGARSVSGVESVDVTVHAGREVLPLPDGALYLGFIFARGKTSSEVTASLRESFSKLEVIIE